MGSIIFNRQVGPPPGNGPSERNSDSSVRASRRRDRSEESANQEVDDDMLFEVAFEGDSWLIEAEYDSDWPAMVQSMCQEKSVPSDDADGALAEGYEYKPFWLRGLAG